MRVLVMGATGYIGSRVIGQLLSRGHAVIAAARNPFDLDAFWWSEQVERVQLDALDGESVSAAFATSTPDALVYLVHGMGGSDFRENDRIAAEHARAACNAASVSRVVYVSGLIPDIAEADLSEHLKSRLEVEEILSRANAIVVTLRAAMIMGAGSTSFELMQQLSNRLPVTVIPDWMRTKVEPVAVTDLVRAVEGALEVEGLTTGPFDVGGGTALYYNDLIAMTAEARGINRAQITVPFLPEALVGRIASLLSDLPSPTVEALVESLQEDMVAREDRWKTALLPDDDTATLSLDQAIERSITAPDPLQKPSERDPLSALPGDPAWTSVEGA